MANFTSQYSKNSSSNYYQATKDVAARSNIQASAYTVDAASMALKGFHYSTCGAGEGYMNSSILTFSQGPGGGFEVSTGIPSPPPSPRANPIESSSPTPVRPGLKTRSRSGGAAYTITEESERLFCDTLNAVFLGEGIPAPQESLVMGMPKSINSNNNNARRFGGRHDSASHLPTPSTSPIRDGFTDNVRPTGRVAEWIEIWDYAGGVRFRGFVAEKDGERALFIFFDCSVIGKDLKQGLMSLLELAGGNDFDCSKLVVCVDRDAQGAEIVDLTRDLGWVGFELTTLAFWSDRAVCTSDKWLFLEMEL